MFTELNTFSLFQLGMIVYLTIADGMNNPVKFGQLYAHKPLIRFIYTAFGAYNVFGSEVGMSLGIKPSLAVCAVMMIMLDVIPMFLQPKEEQDSMGFVPFFSMNVQTYIATAIFLYLYFYVAK